MLPLYRALLHFYPSAYRSEYGEEMMAVLSEVQKEIRKKSFLGRAEAVVRGAGGLLYGAIEEHLRTLTGSYRGMTLSTRRITMRSEFRFPKATVTLMAIILVVVMMAIDKARSIQSSIPYANPHVGPIKTAELTVLPALLIVLVGAGAFGIIGWAVLFALRRSGLHRFSQTNASPNQRSGSQISSAT